MSFGLYKIQRFCKRHNDGLTIAALIASVSFLTFNMGVLTDRFLLPHQTKPQKKQEQKQPLKVQQRQDLLEFRLTKVDNDSVKGTLHLFGQPSGKSQYPIYMLSCGQMFSTTRQESLQDYEDVVKFRNILRDNQGKFPIDQTIVTTVNYVGNSLDKEGKPELGIYRLLRIGGIR